MTSTTTDFAIYLDPAWDWLNPTLEIDKYVDFETELQLFGLTGEALEKIQEVLSEIKSERKASISSATSEIQVNSAIQPLAETTPPKPIAFDRSQTLRQLNYLMDSTAGVTEMRVVGASFVNSHRIDPDPKYGGTLSGYYDNRFSLVADASKLHGVSGFVCLNPSNPALLGRAYNKLIKCRSTTTDEDTVFLRWVLVDVDSVRPSDTSATAEQRKAAHDRRDQLLREHPEIAQSSIWGSSGNGGYIMVHLPDLPNDEAGRAAMASMIAFLAHKYSDTVAKIDPTTRNASRIGPLAGTLKCKGEHLPGKQEWTRVTLDGAAGKPLPENPADDPPVHPLDILSWVAAHPLPEGATTSSKRSRSRPAAPLPAGGGAASPVAPAVASVATGVPRDERLRRAIAYVGKMDGAVSGQGGHNQTFDAACALIKGFDLGIADAIPIMELFNQRCVPPWDQFELHHKIVDADELADDKPRGYLLERGAGEKGGDSTTSGQDNGSAEADCEESGRDRTGKRIVFPEQDKHGNLVAKLDDDPHRLARLYSSRFRSRSQSTLVRHQETYCEWDGVQFNKRLGLEDDLVRVVEGEFNRINSDRIQQILAKLPANKDPDWSKMSAAKQVTSGLIRNILMALNSEIAIDSGRTAPFWIFPGSEDPHPLEILAATNGLLDLATLKLIEHTPNFFSHFSIDYPFDPQAPEPIKWLKFLAELWTNDPAAIRELQKWFGYLLTPDTRLQKILMVIGPKRCGKGTIARVLEALIGKHNVASPSFSSLAQRFGLAPLYNKSVAIFRDAKVAGSISDKIIATERLLNISGEDPVQIEVKYADPIAVKLPTRLVIFANDSPDFLDSSGAWSGRICPLKLTRSFFGEENENLTGELLEELPGILNWAIQGRKFLQEDGKFLIPNSARSLVKAMEEASSPLKNFIEDCCEVIEDHNRSASTLPRIGEVFAAYREWCQGQNQRAKSLVIFSRELQKQVPSIETCRPSKVDDTGRARRFRGVRLTESGLELARRNQIRQATDPAETKAASDAI